MDRRGIILPKFTQVVDEASSISLEEEIEELKEELELYKSLFKSHRNSVIFNLTIKKKTGKSVWVDHVRDDREYLLSLDRDSDVEEWLKPVRPSR
jgi:hypothetical protein